MVVILFRADGYAHTRTSEQAVSSKYVEEEKRGYHAINTRIYTRIGEFCVLFVLCAGGLALRENSIEQKLLKQVRLRGGLCIKFISPGMSGVPDRIVLLPGGRITFVEVKAPGKTPRKLQKAVHAMIRDLGFKVVVLDSIDNIKEVLA